MVVKYTKWYQIYLNLPRKTHQNLSELGVLV
jgi:hypothetical protein